MIRHATMALAILAVTGGLHRAPTIGCLMSCPSFPLVLAAGLLRAVSTAVHLTPIAASTDTRLALAPGTKKKSTGGFRCPIVFPYDICFNCASSSLDRLRVKGHCLGCRTL
jgi:hypothetical protein